MHTGAVAENRRLGESAKTPFEGVAPAPLPKWQQGVALLLGAVGLVAGGVAVLVLGKDGAGTLALVAIGAVFLLIGFRGTWPTSINIGGNQAEWNMLHREVVEAREQNREYATRVTMAHEELALGREDRAREILRQITDPRSADATIARSRQYPYDVASAVQSHVHGAGIIDPDFRDIIAVPLDPDNMSPERPEVLVQGVHTLTLDGLAEMRRFAGRNVVGIIFVVADPLDHTLTSILPRYGRELDKEVEVITWNPDDGPENLKPNVEKLLASFRAARPR